MTSEVKPAAPVTDEFLGDGTAAGKLGLLGVLMPGLAQIAPRSTCSSPRVSWRRSRARRSRWCS
jgi:hypothetical protein